MDPRSASEFGTYASVSRLVRCIGYRRGSVPRWLASVTAARNPKRERPRRPASGIKVRLHAPLQSRTSPHRSLRVPGCTWCTWSWSAPEAGRPRRRAGRIQAARTTVVLRFHSHRTRNKEASEGRGEAAPWSSSPRRKAPWSSLPRRKAEA